MTAFVQTKTAGVKNELPVRFTMKEEGGRLNMVLGKPLEVFAMLIKHFDIVRVCFDQDSEACWLERDNGLKNFCMKYRIQVKVGAD